MLAHALALVGVARLHWPTEVRPAREATRSEVVSIEFPALPARAADGVGGVAAPAPPAVGPVVPGTPPTMPASSTGTAPAEPARLEPAAGAGHALGGGFRDPRLYVDPKALPATLEPPPVYQRLVTDARAAVLAEPDSIAARKARSLASRQVTIMGRKVTVFGDSAAAGFRTEEMELRPDVQTLPVDGRLWQTLEMSRQNSAFVRDSILRARTRATRERIDAARRAPQSRP